MLRHILVLASIAATSSLVLAQGDTIIGLPECARSCVTNYGSCNQVDPKCICSNKPLIANLACCVGAQCDAKGQSDVITFADTLCKAYGITDLPSAATCAPGAVSTPFTGTVSGSAATSGTATPTASSSTTTTGASDFVAPAASATDGPNAAADYKPQAVGVVLGMVGLLAAL